MIIWIMIISLITFNGCTTASNIQTEQANSNSIEKQSNLIHSTSLFEVKEVDKIDSFSPGYIIYINENYLPHEFRKMTIKKTSSHEFDLSSNGVYIHDSSGSGNYGSYNFLIIYQDLDYNYDVHSLIPLPLTLVEQNSDYVLYSYDGFYSENNYNHYTGKIIFFNHNNQKAFILTGKLGLTTSTEYKLKDYYNLP